MDGGFLDHETICVGSNDCVLDKGSKVYLGLLAISNRVAESSLTLGPVATDTEFGCELRRTIRCLLHLSPCLESALLSNIVESDSGILSLGFALLSSFVSIFQAGSVAGGNEPS